MHIEFFHLPIKLCDFEKTNISCQRGDHFEDGQSHVVVLDLHTGKLIDFYSQLNEYYGFGYEDTPVVHEYE